MTDYPHVTAAIINAIREDGTKEEACDWLQKEWNKSCALEAENTRLREALTLIASYGDVTAESRLKITGSYSWFDEPVSVAFARAALEQPK